MGRREKRSYENHKAYRVYYEAILNKIEKMLKGIKGERFESKGVLYDITPLSILIRCSTGLYKDIPSILQVGLEVGGKLDKITLGGMGTEIPPVGVLGLEHIETTKSLGLLESLSIAKYIGEKEGLYKGDLGEAYIENIVNRRCLMSVGYAIYKPVEGVQTEYLDEVYLSGLYAVAQELYTLYEGYVEKGNKEYITDIAKLWRSLKVYDAIPLIIVYKCLCNYVVREQGEKNIVYTDMRISGDVEEDIKKYAGEGYTYILELLKIRTTEGMLQRGKDVVLETELGLDSRKKLLPERGIKREVPERVLSEEDKSFLYLCETYQLLMLYNYIYHYSLGLLGGSIEKGKSIEEDLQKQLIKEKKQREKEKLKIEELYKKKLREKDKEIERLRSKNPLALERELEESNKKIKELELELKSLENKNEYAKERIKKLEADRDRSSKTETKKLEEVDRVKDTESKEVLLEEGVDLTIEEKYEKVKDLKFLLVGGKDKLQTKVKSKYNNVVHIDSIGEVMEGLKLEVGVIVINHISHALRDKVYVEYGGVTWCYMKTLQIDELTELLYDKVKQLEYV